MSALSPTAPRHLMEGAREDDRQHVGPAALLLRGLAVEPLKERRRHADCHWYEVAIHTDSYTLGTNHGMRDSYGNFIGTNVRKRSSGWCRRYARHIRATIERTTVGDLRRVARLKKQGRRIPRRLQWAAR